MAAVEALHRFLVRVFDSREIRMLVRYVEGGEALEAELPSEGASRDALARSAVWLLQRHDRIDPAFFDLLRRERPGRRDEIDALQARFKPEPGTPSSPPARRRWRPWAAAGAGLAVGCVVAYLFLGALCAPTAPDHASEVAAAAPPEPVSVPASVGAESPESEASLPTEIDLRPDGTGEALTFEVESRRTGAVFTVHAPPALACYRVAAAGFARFEEAEDFAALGMVTTIESNFLLCGEGVIGEEPNSEYAVIPPHCCGRNSLAESGVADGRRYHVAQKAHIAG